MSRLDRPGPTVSLEEARRLLLDSLPVLAARSVHLEAALGAVVAAPTCAEEDVPPFANAAMDGYALRAQDAQRSASRLRLVGSVTAGHCHDGAIGEDEAVAISTGSPLPPGADAICMVEFTTIEGDEVVLDAPVRPGQHVRFAGEDIAKGDVVFAPGTGLGPSHIGVLASLGIPEVLVYPRARVGVLSTGDEIREEPGPLEPGQIRDANRHALLALVRAAGCDPVDLGVVGDDEAEIRQAIEGALGVCDAIITSGGVSVGVADHMKAVLVGQSGSSTQWMELAIRPAKPFGFATIGSKRTPVLCLPGNPVAAIVSFELLVRPALRFMTGHTVLDRPRLHATTVGPLLRRRDGNLHVVRVAVTMSEGRLYARPFARQGAHHLSSLAAANALALVPDGDGVDAGQSVPVILLDPDFLPGGTRLGE